jgi:hypothetical protein
MFVGLSELNAMLSRVEEQKLFDQLGTTVEGDSWRWRNSFDFRLVFSGDFGDSGMNAIAGDTQKSASHWICMVSFAMKLLEEPIQSNE